MVATAGGSAGGPAVCTDGGTGGAEGTECAVCRLTPSVALDSVRRLTGVTWRDACLASRKAISAAISTIYRVTWGVGEGGECHAVAECHVATWLTLSRHTPVLVAMESSRRTCHVR